MLLTCDRHTAADLVWWRGTETADLVHGERLAKSERGSSAIAVMRAFANTGPCYVGTSWGKDSLVVAHLLHLSGLKLPLVHIVQEGPLKDPFQATVRDAFLAIFPCDYHEIIVPGDNRISDNGRHAPQLDRGIRLAAKQFGGRRYISGLRAEESGVRKIRARTGLSEASCWPLCWWSADDVFSWIAHHGLPLHPAYGMTGGGRWDRRQLRVSTIGGPKGNQFGRAEWENCYYGDILRRRLQVPAV